MLPTWLDPVRPASSRPAAQRRRGRGRAGRRLSVERLEDRLAPAADYLLVTNVEKHNVLRYDARSGAFVDEFVRRKSGRLSYVWGAVFGPHDHDLYVSCGHWFGNGGGQTKAVLRYDGTTGAFDGEFVRQGQMLLVHGITFGPDGNVYVGDKMVLTNGHQLGGRIMRFDGRTGAFMGEFVPLDSGGLKHPAAHVFGPDGAGGLDLYVSNEGPANILRYDGTTGAFKGEFVAGGSGGLSLPNGVVFGPDGNLYVASFGSASVMRYQGLSGGNPGAPLPAAGNGGATFVAAGSGGMLYPTGILFGPDGNGDGRQDLYVASADPTNIQGKLGNVKRYDGVTGAFIDTFVPARSGGLDDPSLMTFTQTDPVTLAYTGGRPAAAATAPNPFSQPVVGGQGQSMKTEVLNPWRSADIDVPALNAIDPRVTDPSSRTLSLASGHTVGLADNAAGRGRLIDPTPSDDREFSTAGDRGEQDNRGLLTVQMHGVGHLPGLEHAGGEVTSETLTAGEWLTLSGVSGDDLNGALLPAERDGILSPAFGKRKG